MSLQHILDLNLHLDMQARTAINLVSTLSTHICLNTMHIKSTSEKVQDAYGLS